MGSASCPGALFEYESCIVRLFMQPRRKALFHTDFLRALFRGCECGAGALERECGYVLCRHWEPQCCLSIKRV